VTPIYLFCRDQLLTGISIRNYKIFVKLFLLKGKIMQLTVLDRSNYLKGLLILIGKDKKITEDERELFLRLSKVLGFNKKFCDDAINELSENEYIIEEPPLFSDRKIAEAFLKDCMRLAFLDKDLHLYELNWIKSTGEKNNISLEWRVNEFEKIKNVSLPPDSEFEICQLLHDSE